MFCMKILSLTLSQEKGLPLLSPLWFLIRLFLDMWTGGGGDGGGGCLRNQETLVLPLYLSDSLGQVTQSTWASLLSHLLTMMILST